MINDIWYVIYDILYMIICIYIYGHMMGFIGLIFPTKPILIKQVQAALAGLRHTLCFCLALPHWTGQPDWAQNLFLSPGCGHRCGGQSFGCAPRPELCFFLGWNPQMNGESDELYWWNDWNGSHTQHTVVFISGDQVTSLTGDSSLWENSPLDTPCSSPAKSAGTASLTLQQKLLRKIMEHQDSTARRVDR